MRKISLISFIVLIVALCFSSCKKPEIEDSIEDVPIPEEEEITVFVSKEKEAQRILLDEFTGHQCQYCPDGHKRANTLATQHPNQLYVMNIHAGSLSSFNSSGSTYKENFRTPEGTELYTYYKIKGVPSGVINRCEYTLKISGKDSIVVALNRGYWASVINQIKGNLAPANVAAKTKIKKSDRTLECEVQACFTEAVAETSYIHVAILQNEIIGDQTNGGENPDYVTTGGKYRHMHVFRGFITGTWGEAMTVDKDSFYRKKFTYTLPENVENVGLDINNIEILVFITNGDGGKGRVLTVNKSQISIE